jgi:hypothetical protein
VTYTTFFTSRYPRASNDYRSYYLLPDSGTFSGTEDYAYQVSLSGRHIQFQAYADCFDNPPLAPKPLSFFIVILIHENYFITFNIENINFELSF